MIGVPKDSRTLSPFHQALFALRWFREAGPVHPLARNVHISQATGYRYLHEAIDVLAEQAPTCTTSSNSAANRIWHT